MKPEAIQKLATLETLMGSPIYWDGEERGELNVLDLLVAENFVTPTDPKFAIYDWECLEERGCVVEEYTPCDRDNVLDEATQEFRQTIYREVLEILNSELTEVVGLEFSCKKRQDYFEFSDKLFYIFVILGKTKDDGWICLTPTLPREISFDDREYPGSKLILPNPESKIHTETLELRDRLQNCLDRLPAISIYGYEGGGYDYRYNHKILCEASSQRSMALQNALIKAGALEVREFENISEDLWNLKVAEFFNSDNFPYLFLYRISFWDRDYIYVWGLASDVDWIGWQTQLDFEFNP
ncbi:MAG: hypothetical protein J7641_10995 [Cyanobacteria bacterium SID2]|nr:hypothetical protein [Cyanobacteria bacterium SID2]MBP0002284.1 hypothetical protein [Cyanobacteria bacterium SBC]